MPGARPGVTAVGEKPGPNSRPLTSPDSLPAALVDLASGPSVSGVSPRRRENTRAQPTPGVQPPPGEPGAVYPAPPSQKAGVQAKRGGRNQRWELGTSQGHLGFPSCFSGQVGPAPVPTPRMAGDIHPHRGLLSWLCLAGKPHTAQVVTGIPRSVLNYCV